MGSNLPVLRAFQPNPARVRHLLLVFFLSSYSPTHNKTPKKDGPARPIIHARSIQSRRLNPDVLHWNKTGRNWNFTWPQSEGILHRIASTGNDPCWLCCLENGPLHPIPILNGLKRRKIELETGVERASSDVCTKVLIQPTTRRANKLC